MTTNILLYKKMYNRNKYFIIQEDYNKNTYCYYIRRRIIETNISLYKKMYNEMFVCFYYTRRSIIKILIGIIQEDV